MTIRAAVRNFQKFSNLFENENQIYQKNDDPIYWNQRFEIDRPDTDD